MRSNVEVGRRIKIDDDIYIVAMVCAYGSARSYNLIDVNTGYCWFATPKDYENFKLLIENLANEYEGVEFIQLRKDDFEVKCEECDKTNI